MLNEFKNILLAGIGAAATTYEKSSKLIDDMVEKGKITVDEGKELSQELKRTLKDKENKSEESTLTKEDMKELLNEMNFVSKKDLDELSSRISKLEEKNK